MVFSEYLVEEGARLKLLRLNKPIEDIMPMPFYINKILVRRKINHGAKKKVSPIPCQWSLPS